MHVQWDTGTPFCKYITAQRDQFGHFRFERLSQNARALNTVSLLHGNQEDLLRELAMRLSLTSLP